MSAGVAAPPHADPISVDAVEGLRKRDRMAVVAHLDLRVQLLPRLAFALAEVPVVVGEHDMPGARDRRRVLIEVELLQAVVTVRHDDDRRVRCDRSRTVEPPAQRGSLRIELDVGDLEPVVLPDHMATLPHALAARGYYLTGCQVGCRSMTPSSSVSACWLEPSAFIAQIWLSNALWCRSVLNAISEPSGDHA